MQGQWINQAPYYRCRYPNQYALANTIPHPRNIYLRQDTFDTDVHHWLASLFTPDRLNQTIDQMMAGQQTATDNAAAEAATTTIADANLKLARYRAALDAGGDPQEIGKWITETTTQRLKAQADLRQATNTTTLTRQQIQALIEDCADIATDLHHTQPADIATTYRKLGLRVTYHPEKQLIRAAARPRPTNIGNWSVSEEGLAH
jgi:site-specific DNA recombinase